MLAYEIHVVGPCAADEAERVRASLEAACGEHVDPALPLPEDPTVRALLLPPGVEWSFERLRTVVGELRAVSPECAVTLVGVPEDDEELARMLFRQAELLERTGHAVRAAALRREADRVSESS